MARFLRTSSSFTRLHTVSRVPDGMGWLIRKGLYGAHQSGAIWAKTFHAWMHKNYPQYVEAGNERCVYVMRESGELAPISLDEL